MADWEVVRSSDFEVDIESKQIDIEELDKWLGVLKENPRKMKSAHGLSGPLKNYWSSYFSQGKEALRVIYMICDGRRELCFRGKVKVLPRYVDFLTHSCNSNHKVIFILRMIPHNYKLL